MLRKTPGNATFDATGTRRRVRRRNAINTAIGLTVAAGLAVAIWEGPPDWLSDYGLKDHVLAKNLGRVEPGLWRSGQISPYTIGPALRRIDADLIVSLSPDNPDNDRNMAEFRAAERLGLPRVHVNLRGDGTGDPMEYVTALRHVIRARERGETVLVHCWAGSERTSGLVALYRTLYRGEDAAASSAEMGEFGHEYDEGVLIDYLNEHVAFIADRLANPEDPAEAPVIDRVPDPLPRFAVP